MVTIIKEGVIKPKVEPWPYNGDELKCSKCGCVFTIEKADRYRVTQSRQPGSLAVVEGVCPFCAEDIRIADKRAPGREDPWVLPWKHDEAPCQTMRIQ